MGWFRVVSAAYKVAKWSRYRERNRVVLAKKEKSRRERKREEDVMKVGRGNPEQIYYVYELYTILPNGQRRVYYVGKGSGDRMYTHEKTYRRKLKNSRSVLDCKEKTMLLLEDMGCTLYATKIQSGLNEDEAFNLEHDVIYEYGMQNLTNVAFPHRPRIAYA